MNRPECGAFAEACESRFNEFLAIEFTEAGYGAVHHLTVATYLLQHSSMLSLEGWIHERNLLGEFLIHEKSPVLVRRRNENLFDSGKRKFIVSSNNGRLLFVNPK